MLEQHVAAYLAKLAHAAIGNRHDHHARMVEAASSGALSLGVEVVWKTHMLRPLLYAQACAISSQPKDGAALDLVAAVQRQEVFMRKVVARVVRAARFFAALVARVASGCKQERQERRMGRCGRTEVCIMARYVV